MALAVLRRPAAFGAALIDIPVLDLVRYGAFTGGSLWRDEIGWGETEEDVSFLRSVSPYHAAREGCQTPTLVSAGARDEVAVPLHAYKYVAALQAGQTCASPVLLQVVEGAGHSLGASPEQAARSWARQLAFVELALKGH
jgi:prolyl oligopeptidase